MEDIRRFCFALEKLNKIARTVRKINENDCNYQISKSQITRRENLEAEAGKIAAEFGLEIYCQRDPRGAALHLYDPKALAKDAFLTSCYSSIAYPLG